MLRSLLLATAMTFTTPALADPVHDATQAALPQLMEFYRDFHANPELSTHEVKTAAKLAEEARKAGYKVTEKVGGTGVVAVLENGPGPVLLIRADMDGLPVTEATGLPFASKVRTTNDDGIESGVMHACGHDTHMASWIGTLRNLAAMKAKWHGTVVMIAQPAEERGLGARAMLDDGLFTRFPKPQFALAFHDSAGAPAGQIGVTAGYALANVDSVDITVKGVGGHGAYPQTTKDPIVLAARIVGALQTLVSREVDPQEAAVVTVGMIKGGSTHNIIGSDVTMLLTVRSFKPEVRKLLLDGIARIARGEAIAAGVPDDRMPEIKVRDNFTPATFNTQPITDRMKALWTARFGKDRVVETKAVMGGEDFSRYWLADNSIQSLIFWVGGVPADKWAASDNGKKPLPSLHSAYWAPDAEAVVGTATEAMTAAALDILKK
ncbi:amidohydrolase [Sphingomonas kyeonggiensis]|uniref:Hippurate hydrolase n=1 Tax=Sphingomonas kyeonggiensis TaxID=1268553 RepID=A0A7W6JRT4_9SPHN|nr:amidohydrolase [Sphingomonas kyeonggiensis]MBB4098305.1 hippurate hydrolase [Sphingomonas kyeonggiensis]